MIKFQKVTQRFPNGTVAFSDLSFTVDDGELVLITGPSGSGKTTIMNLLMNEYSPADGEIIFEGEPLNKIRTGHLPKHRRKIGVVFQDYKLVEELNVWENIALPLYILGEKQADIEDRVTDLLKLVELTDKALTFPKQLSGGEAQRISIARALATGPSLIFADEPTGNLDTETANHIISLLAKINELGTTLIIATHDPLIVEKFKTKVVDLAQLEQEIEEKAEKSQAEAKSEKAKPDKSPKPSQKKKIKKEDKKQQSSEEDKKTEEKPDDKSQDDQTQDDREDKTKISLPMNAKKVRFRLGSLFSKKKKPQDEDKSESKEDDQEQDKTEPAQPSTEPSTENEKKEDKPATSPED